MSLNHVSAKRRKSKLLCETKTRTSSILGTRDMTSDKRKHGANSAKILGRAIGGDEFVCVQTVDISTILDSDRRFGDVSEKKIGVELTRCYWVFGF